MSIESLATYIAKRKTDGIDFDLSYVMRFGRFGDLSTKLYWTHVLNFEETDIEEDPSQTVNIDGEIFRPKDRGQLTLGFTYSGHPVAAGSLPAYSLPTHVYAGYGTGRRCAANCAWR